MIVTEYMENGSLDTFLRVSTQLHDGFECTTSKETNARALRDVYKPY